jgi:putative transposase
MCYHVLNRGNGRAEIFHKDGDYAAFLDLMVEANERLPPLLKLRSFFFSK